MVQAARLMLGLSTPVIEPVDEVADAEDGTRSKLTIDISRRESVSGRLSVYKHGIN
jgi:hypothetical protein